MSNQFDQNFDEPIDVVGAAKILKLKKSSIYQLTHQRRIKFYKIGGGKIYFKREDLLDYAYADKNSVLTREEAEDMANQQILREQ